MLDAFQELIDELLAAPGHLRELNAAATGHPEARELVALISARDAALLERVQTTIRQNSPLLRAAPDSAQPEGDSTELLAAFDHGRGELISLLMNLTLKDWERTAIDAAGAEITVADDVERHVEFDEEARARLDRLLGS